MDYWNESSDHLSIAKRQVGGEDNFTTEQLLQVAQIEALLAIGAELSRIQDQGVNPEWSQRN